MLGYYLNNGNQIKRNLSEEEQDKLFLLSKEGDYNAQQKLFQNNIRLVLKVISVHFNHLNKEEQKDAFQIGCIGLWNAVRAFDPELKVKFSTFAFPTILGEIKNSYRFGNQLHIPSTIQNLYKKIIKIKQEYQNEGIEIDNKDLAMILNVTEEEISLALNSKNKITSLFEPIKNSNSSKEKYFEEIIPDTNSSVEDEIDKKIFIQEIANIINELEFTEKEIIKMSFGIGCEIKSQQEISKRLNISKNKIIDVKKKALFKLRKEILERPELTEEIDISHRVKKQKEKKTYKLKSPETLFDEFPEYTKEQILESINFLSKDNKRALTIVYNLNPNEINSPIELETELNSITKNIRAYIYISKKQLKNILENGPKQEVNFFDLFEGYSELQVLEAINKLTITDKELIDLKYGLNGQIKHTNKEISKILNIERDSVRKVLERIKKIIKRNLINPEVIDKNQVMIKDQSLPKTKKKKDKIENTLKEQIKNKPVEQIRKGSIFDLFPENTIEEVINVIETLDPESQFIIKLRYGLENREPIKLVEIEKQYNIKNASKKVYSIIRKIKKELEHDTIFELYPNYSEEQILGTISTLSKYKRNLIEKRYALNGKIYTLLTQLAEEYNVAPKEINKKIQAIHQQLKRRLEKGQFKRETIFELYPNYSEEQILKSINTLTELNKKIIEMKFGLNNNEYYELKEISEILKIDFKKLNSRYGQILKGIENRLQKGIFEKKTIFNTYSNYTEKEILGSISALQKEEKNIIERRYGLNGQKITSLEELALEMNKTKNEISKKIEVIKRKIKRNLENGIFKEETIFDYFPEYTEEEVLKAIETLKSENQVIIKLRFGLCGYTSMKAIDIEKKYNIQRASARVFSILEQIRNRLEQGKFEEKTIYDYFPQYSKEQILGSISNLPYDERILIERRYSLNNFNFVTNEELGKELNQSATDISRRINKIRTKIQNNLEKGIFEPRTIFHLFPEYTEEEVLNVIEMLKPESKFLIKIRYGLNGEEPMKAIEIEKKYNIPLVSRKILLIRQQIERRLLKEKIKAECIKNPSIVKTYTID